jgi:hypothetical protein
LKIKKKYLSDCGRPNTGCTGLSKIRQVQLTKNYKIRAGQCRKNTKKKFDQFFMDGKF